MLKIAVFSFITALSATQAWAGVSITHCQSSTGQHFCRTEKDLVVIWPADSTSISVVAQNAYGCEIPYEKKVVLENAGSSWRSRDGKVSLTVTSDLIKYDDLDLPLDEHTTAFHYSRASCGDR